MKKKKNRAVALIVVLSVIVILTLIVVSLAVAMRLERQAAYYFSERSRADFMVREGVEMAKLLLNDAYQTNNYVVSMPGRLMVIPQGSNAWTNVELSSGVGNASATGVLAAPDLNRLNKTGDGLRQIDPLGGPMTLSWVYVYQNGDRTTNASPAISSNNPVIGRYAFWVDDESTRINLNTARKRMTNSHILAQVELQSISEQFSESDADTIYSQTKGRPLQSLSEIFRIGTNYTDAVSSNRFYATHYNHSPDLNPWGEHKIILTTQLSKLPAGFTNIPNYTNYFLDILKTNNADPGSGTIANTIDFNKFDVRMKTLVGYLSRTNWPLFPGKSFAQKYKPGNPDRIAQLALDIIEYVRSAESTNEAVPMIRARWNGSAFIAGGVAAGDFLGTTRSPLLTEIGLWVSDTTNSSGYFEGRLKAELYLPPHYGLSSFKVAGNDIGVQLNGGAGTNGPNSAGGGTVLNNHSIAASEVSGDPMTPGSYALVTTPKFNLQEATLVTNGTNPPYYPPFGTNNMRVRVFFSSGNIWEQGNGVGSPIPYALPAVPRPAIDSAELTSTEVDDPRINKTLLDWKMRTPNSGNTFGQQNSIWKTAASTSPQQDKEGSSYSDYSLSMPPPKGAPGNEDGKVVSVAELGRISTGIETATNAYPPAAWRTVRLQPTSTTNTDIPDWALLDLFTVPVTPAPGQEPIYFPNSNSISGRININASIEPFATNSKAQAIRALLGSSPGKDSIITNIINHTLANNGRAFGSTDFYKSVGELAEIEKVSDTGEHSEAQLREITSMATVRSGVFRVYCIGQSLKQTPSGGLVVNASKSVEVLLENPTPSNPLFRPATWRETPF